jgi:hypothetical protein
MELADKINPRAIWPLVRMTDEEISGAEMVYLSDAEMIMLRIALRIMCRHTRYIPDDGDRDLINRYAAILEKIRHKLETVLDLEFEEGRFEEAAGEQEGGG